MRVSRLLRSWFAVLGISILPQALQAQVVPSPYQFITTRQEYGLFAGYASYGTGRFGYGPRSGLLIGARYAVRLRGPVAFEASGTILNGTRAVMDPSRSAGQRKIGNTSVRVGAFDVGLRFSVVGDRTWRGLNPFIDMGIGYAFPMSGATSMDKRLPSDYQFGFSSTFDATLGAGTRFFVTKRLSLRGDATWALWKLSTPPGFADPTLGYFNSPRSEWVSGVRLTLAILLNR